VITKIKNILKEFAKKGEYYRTLYRKAQMLQRKWMYRKFYHLEKTNDKMIVFEAFLGRSYACNPKALYLTMLKDDQYKDFQFVWAVNNVEKHAYLKKNKNTTVVKRISYAYHKSLGQAKYIIFNSGLPAYVKLREDQIYIQTWHGTPLKRLGCDIKAGGSAAFGLKEIHKQYRANGKKFTYLLSPSAFVTDKFATAFDLTKERLKQIIIEEGYPRNDALFQYKMEQLQSFQQNLELPADKKIILYAPTFRDNNYEFSVGFKYNDKLDFDTLKEEIGDEAIVLFRAHCQIADKFDFTRYDGFVYNVSKYEDINELFAISDLLITDYSSVLFDYANLKKPMIFYMYDLDEYQNSIRDFYLNLEELPGPIVMNEEELTKEIRNLLGNFKYDEKYRAFNEKYNYLDGSDCSEKVLKRIMK
jgi:CDP-glycerol glycerophosphotransferase